eukprot:jgi/Botrbrau1/7327/Bobra.247_3s0022.1
MISALWIMIATKLDGGFQQFYSVHAWTGILVIVLSVAQAFVGLGAFVFFKDRLDANLKARIMALHRVVGRLTLIFA